MNSKRDILLNFEDMWPGFDKKDNYFYRLLSTVYNVVLSERPEFLIFGDYGQRHKRYDCIRIHYVSENWRPNFKHCDFAFSFDHEEINGRNYRLPLYALYLEKAESKLGINHQHLSDGLDAEATSKVFNEKDKFCCMLVSNPRALERIQFFHRLSEYKPVDSGGKVLNNIGNVVEDKLAFLLRYKFVIAFENSSWPGYTTEKIFEAFSQHCVPIYWGDPLVSRDFDTGSFVNVHDYDNYDAVVERIKEIDQDDEEYHRILMLPKFANGTLPVTIRPEEVLRKFDEIFEQDVNMGDQNLKRAIEVRYWRVIDHKHRIAQRLKARFPMLRKIRPG